MLRKIWIEGFKSISKLEFEPGRVNLFIGANGCGKSNILEGIGVLGAAASGRVDDESLLRRGVRPGIPNIYKSSFKDIKASSQIKFGAALNDDIYYEVTLKNPVKNPSPAWHFKTERLTGSGRIRVVSRSARDKNLNPEQGLAALQLVRIPAHAPEASLMKLLQDFAIFSPNTPALRSLAQDPQIRWPVGLSGGGLAEALAYLFAEKGTDDNLKSAFGNINELFDWTEGFGFGHSSKMRLSPSAAISKYLVLFYDRFMRPKNNHLTGYDASEGALYIIFYALLALLSTSPLCLAIDNVDQAMNPRLVCKLIERLCEWTRLGERKRQMFLAAHNPAILDGLDMQDPDVRLFVVDRDNHGHTVVSHIDIQKALALRPDEGWTLSRMWMNGILGGVPNV